MKLLVTLSSLALVGCCQPQPKPPNFDSYLTSACEVQILKKDFKSWDDVLAEKAENNKQMIKCLQKHEALVNSLNNYKREFSK